MTQDSFLKSFRETKSPFITNPYRFAVAVAPAGGWVELARTTTGSALSDFSVGSLADKRYYMVLTNIQGKNNAGVNWQTRMGNGSIDTGSNYGMRYSLNGGADSASGSSTTIQSGTNPTNLPQFNVAYISNLSGKEKLYMSHDVNQETAGAGNAPERGEYTGKWANTSNPLDIIGATTSSSYTMSSGSEMVVLGWDPADTHTTNFWEELASVSGDGTSNTLSSGTITAKKYLWVQAYGSVATQMDNMGFQFNSDTGSNYAKRISLNGVDQTAVSQTFIRLGSGSPTNGSLFGSGFIINNSANEKLLTSHWARNRSSGAGTAPERFESTGKWANTSSQITSVQLIHDGSSNWDSDSIIKVWGSN
jgi:hypothetical protein